MAKVLGTLASVAGATVITLYKGPTIYKPTQTTQKSHILASLGDHAKEKNWTFGCLCLICRCLCWSSWFILQAPLLKKYPARLSVTSYTCFFSILQFFTIAALVEKDSKAWKVQSGGELFILFYSVSCLVKVFTSKWDRFSYLGFKSLVSHWTIPRAWFQTFNPRLEL